jgi:hypothetical protein
LFTSHEQREGESSSEVLTRIQKETQRLKNRKKRLEGVDHQVSLEQESMLPLENQDVSPTLIRTGDDVGVRDGRSSISRSLSGTSHILRVTSRDEQEPSMSHLGLSSSSGSMGGVSGHGSPSHLDISPRGSASRLREGSKSTVHPSFPASLGSREPLRLGVGRSKSDTQPGVTRGVRSYHSMTNTVGTDTPRSRRLGVKPSKNRDGVMKPIEKSNSGLASLFGGGNPKKSRSKKEEAPSLGAGSHARKREYYPRF